MPLDPGIVRHLDRARVYGLLSHLFQPPKKGTAAEIRFRRLPDLDASLAALGAGPELRDAAAELSSALSDADDRELVDDWEANFESSGKLQFSPTETAHTAKNGQEAWVKTFRIADIAGFYKAFGLEVIPGTDRPDHLGAELEFLEVLALKEAVALDQGDATGAGVCAEATRWFLEEHLGEWTDAVLSAVGEGHGRIYPTAAALLDWFVAMDRDATWHASRTSSKEDGPESPPRS